MPVTGINHVTLSVTDLALSISFYTENLGGQLRAQWSRGAYLELGSLWLCLTLSDTLVQQRDDYTHLALSCEPKDFGEICGKIKGAATLWQEDRSEGSSLYFRDPDGHKLELHLGDLASRLAHYHEQADPNMRIYDNPKG